MRKIQLNMIEYDNASLLVTFSGFKKNVDDFIKQYNIRNIISMQKVSENPTFDKFIVKATLSKNELQKIVNDLKVSDFYPT
jgi:cell division protein FtsX